MQALDFNLKEDFDPRTRVRVVEVDSWASPDILAALQAAGYSGEEFRLRQGADNPLGLNIPNWVWDWQHMLLFQIVLRWRSFEPRRSLGEIDKEVEKSRAEVKAGKKAKPQEEPQACRQCGGRIMGLKQIPAPFRTLGLCLKCVREIILLAQDE